MSLAKLPTLPHPLAGLGGYFGGERKSRIRKGREGRKMEATE